MKDSIKEETRKGGGKACFLTFRPRKRQSERTMSLQVSTVERKSTHMARVRSFIEAKWGRLREVGG